MVIFRDGKYLTLKEVFESLKLTGERVGATVGVGGWWDSGRVDSAPVGLVVLQLWVSCARASRGPKPLPQRLVMDYA